LADSPAVADEEERRIVAAARRGDRDAFARLVERYGAMVMSLAYASTMDVGEAEDVGQETFLAAWRALPGFRQEAAVSSWLYRLARSRCVDRARRLAARPVTTAFELDQASVAASLSPDAMAIMRAAGRLPLEQRQAVLMRDVQGLSYDEISLAQDVPLGTVRSRIAVGRSTIAAALGEDGEL
jgi:RNA polymerase sigma-70 factor, ECF subfamily